jgi:hypothetical protein
VVCRNTSWDTSLGTCGAGLFLDEGPYILTVLDTVTVLVLTIQPWEMGGLRGGLKGASDEFKCD